MQRACLRTAILSVLLGTLPACSDDAAPTNPWNGGDGNPFAPLPDGGASAQDGDGDAPALDGGLNGSGDSDESATDSADGTGDLASDGSGDLGDAAGDGDTMADGAGDGSELPHFSFFVTSLSAMRQLSGSQNGFGGNLSYGETGEGAGLRGADKICAEIAELSMDGASAKQWRAFLSTTSENAKDRIGSGPWYDRNGRLVAQNLSDLLNERPEGADALIVDDLPNERGEPNRAGSAENGQDDNHDVLTGTDENGNYDGGETCSDWTSTTASGSGGGDWWGGGSGPRLGHSWPAQSGQNWMAAHSAHGCAAGVNLVQNGPGSGDSVGAGGGYGGIYCFALTP